ncbi:YopX family protein [Secundilactobacillus similis]|nr:YopX family protein [Secundilactobacillus similis]
MSREIKFRIWRAPDEYTKVSWMESWDSLLNYSMSDIFQLDNPDDVVEQYTGVKDANGKEIYEGDIIEATIEGCVQDDKYLVKNMWDPHVWTEESDNYYAVQKMELKGNIHENPELLEAQHG